MSKIIVQSLTKSYSGKELFQNIGFEVVPGMRLAVAGANGCGKSTLLRILARELEPDSGSVIIPKNARVGYVAQDFLAADLEKTLIDWVLEVLPSWDDFWKRWEDAVQKNDEQLLVKLGKEQEMLEAEYGYAPEHKAEAILLGLGFEESDFSKIIGTLSGGWQNRVKLGRVLLQGADILLLDEPTNHLDLEAIEWLEKYLLQFAGALVLVVHDRIFLENVGNAILYISQGKTNIRKGTFSEFLIWEKENSEQLQREAAKISARIDHEQSFADRFGAKASKATQAQSKLKKITKLKEELGAVSGQMSKANKTLNFRLPKTSRADKIPLMVSDLSFEYENGTKPIWSGLSFQVYRQKKIAFLAQNGAGKSTLLKLLVGGLKPNAGEIQLGGHSSIGYFSQHQTEILEVKNTVLTEIRRLTSPALTEETLMGVLGLFLLSQKFFQREVGKLSGGEKSRLLLAILFLSNHNVLVLDEPTNHLDLETREGLINALANFDGTLLFVAHDRFLLTEVAEELWLIEEGGIVIFYTFDEYEEYKKEKQLKNIGQAKEPVVEVEIKEVVAQEDKGKKDKESKRKEADERNAHAKKIKPLQQEYEKLEKELEKKIALQTEKESAMGSEEALSQQELLLKLSVEYSEVSKEIEMIFEEMSKLEEIINVNFGE